MTLVLQNLHYFYDRHSPRSLFCNTIQIHEGTSLAVIGGNGTGKTTFLKIICGLHRNYTGYVDRPSDWTCVYVPAAQRQFLLPWYCVSQNINFFATKGENVTTVVNQGAIDDLSGILGRPAFDLAQRRIYSLSTGELASVSLICALSTAPKVLLLDEIFANLSVQTITNMKKRLISFKESAGVIVYTSHRRETDDLADQILTVGT